MVLDHSTMFASVCVNPACAHTRNTGSFCFTAALSSLRAGTLAIVNGWFPRTEICGSQMYIGVLAGVSCQSVGHGYSLYKLRCPPTHLISLSYTPCYKYTHLTYKYTGVYSHLDPGKQSSTASKAAS